MLCKDVDGSMLSTLSFAHCLKFLFHPNFATMIARAFTSFVAAAACLPSLVAAHTHAAKRTASSNVVTFANDQELLFDTDGNQIDAYATKINCKDPHAVLFLFPMLTFQTSTHHLGHNTSCMVSALPAPTPPVTVLSNPTRPSTWSTGSTMAS